MVDKIWTWGGKHPFVAHLSGYFLMAVTLISLDFYMNGNINAWYITFPAFWFLTWLLNDYYTFSYSKQWGIYFFVVFSLMSFLNKELWINWTSIGGLAVILASVGVLSSWRSRRKNN